MKRKKGKPQTRFPVSSRQSAYVPPLGLSLCMIVKNEAENLEACLRSVRPVIDEIIVVDTGSTDGTRTIARRMGARVYRFRWCNDFSAARNESIRHATGDYILWLDADERVDEPEIKKIAILKKMLPPRGDRAFYALVNSESPEGTTLFYQLRIFPRVEGAAFEGKVHEQIFYRLRKIGIEFIKTDVVIRHTGYHEVASKLEKSKRNLEILEKELESDPGSLHLQYNAARTLSGMGMQRIAIHHLKRIVQDERVKREERGFFLEAALLIGKYYVELEHYEEAVLILRQLSKEFEESGLVHFCLGEALFFTKDFDAAVEELEKARHLPLEASLFPINLDRLDCYRYYRLGQCYLETGRFDLAKEMLLKALHLDQSHCGSLEALGLLSLKTENFEEAVQYYEKAIGKGEISDQSYVNLGLVLHKLGRGPQAEEAFIKALEINPERSEALIHLGHLRYQIKEYAEARDWFNKALALDPDRMDVRLVLSEICFCQWDLEGLVLQCDALLKELELPYEVTFENFGELGALYEKIGEVYSIQGKSDLSLLAYHVSFLIFPDRGVLEKIVPVATSLNTLSTSLRKIEDALAFHGRQGQKQNSFPLSTGIGRDPDER